MRRAVEPEGIPPSGAFAPAQSPEDLPQPTDFKLRHYPSL